MDLVLFLNFPGISFRTVPVARDHVFGAGNDKENSRNRRKFRFPKSRNSYRSPTRLISIGFHRILSDFISPLFYRARSRLAPVVGRVWKCCLHGHRQKSCPIHEFLIQMDWPGESGHQPHPSDKIQTIPPAGLPRCGEDAGKMRGTLHAVGIRDARAPSQISVKSLILGRNLPLQRATDAGKTSTGRRQVVSVAFLSPP